MNNICKICSKKFDYKWGKKLTCSSECLKKWKKSPEYISAWKEKVKSTTMSKYGVEHTSSLPSTKLKAEQTFLRKYGAKSPTLNQEVRKKQISTNLERYGTITPLHNSQIRESTRETLIKNHGVETPFSSDSIRNKAKLTKLEKYDNEHFNNHAKAIETNLKKYGVKNVSEVNSIREKIENTCIEKYGCSSALASTSVRKKIINSNKKKYSAENPMQNKEVSLKQRTSRLKLAYDDIFNKKLIGVVKPLFSEEEYIGTKASGEYKFQCCTCLSEFNSSVSNGKIPRCPICFPVKNNISRFENEIVEYVQQLVGKEKIQQHNRELLSPKEIDIYLPEQQIAIELNGNYWHSENSGKKYKNYHINKTKKCEQVGVTLLHIFEDEWIQKQDIIKNKLTYILQPNSVKKIHGRKCEIKPVSAKESNEFLTKFHLQGKDKSSVRYGAYFESKLVAVATFGKLRIALGEKTRRDGVYELYRYCSVGKVAGILSKLISRFIKDYSPKKIITYADRRFSNKKTCGYSKCGFSLVKETSPNYWYLDKNYGTREHRFNYRKSALPSKLKTYNPKLTEWENMQANGYDRIWDCGHLKYEMQIDQA